MFRRYVTSRYCWILTRVILIAFLSRSLRKDFYLIRIRKKKRLISLTMGNGESKARAEAAEDKCVTLENHQKERVLAQTKYQAELDKQRDSRENLYQTTMIRMQHESEERINSMEAQRAHLEESHERAMAKNAEQSHEERMTMIEAHNRRVKEKDDAIATERRDMESRIAELRKKHEDDMKEWTGKLEDEKNGRLEDNKQHKVELMDERQLRIDDAKESQAVIQAVEREKAVFAVGWTTSSASYATGIVKLAESHTVENDAKRVEEKIQKMREAKDRISALKSDVDVMLLEIAKKGILSRTNTEKAAIEESFKLAAKEIAKLNTLIRETYPLVGNFGFHSDLIDKAKLSLTKTQDKIADLENAISKVKLVLVKTPKEVSLDGIVDCIKALNEAINSFPSLVTQSFYETARIEMEKIAIDVNKANIAIAAQKDSILALEQDAPQAIQQ